MANNISNVGFAPTDYAAEQADIERRRAYAQQLQQQGQTPIESQTAGGWVIPTSPTQGLAKMLQSYAGRKGQEAATEQQKQLGRTYQSELARTLMEARTAERGTPARTVNPDEPGMGMQSFEQPAVAPDRERMAAILMGHPGTQQLGMNEFQQQLQFDRLRQATEGSAQPPSAAPPAAVAPGAPGLTGMPAQPGQAPTAPSGAGAPPQAQPSVGSAGQYDLNGVPLAISQNLRNLDPTGGEYTKYMRQLHEPKISANGQVMQYQRQADGSWGYAPGAGALGAARQYADVGEQAKAANTPATITFNNKSYDTTQDIANAIRSGQAPDEATAMKAAQWAHRNNIPFSMGLPEGATFKPLNERNLLPPDNQGGGSAPPSSPAGRFGAPTVAMNKYSETDAGNAAAYKNTLNERVQQGGDLNMRLQATNDALQEFRTGGGKETRAHLAQIAQAIGAPDSIVNGIAGGNLAAAQEFQKFQVTQAMEQLRLAMGGTGRITQAEFQVFLKANPNLSTDPNAIKKLTDFATKIYNRDLQEQDALGKWESEGKDPTQFRSFWAQETTRRGFTNPKLKANPAGAAAEPEPPKAQIKYARNPQTGERIMSTDNWETAVPAH